MDRVRQILANIRRQLGSLDASRRLLLACICVIAVMVLVLATLLTGRSDTVALFPTATPEEQAQFAAHFDQSGLKYTLEGGRVMVPADQAAIARAQVAQAQLLPSNASQAWMDLVKGQSWITSKGQMEQINTLALSRYLSSIATNFEGIKDASVVISAPETRGFGQSARKPTGQVTVWPERGGSLAQTTVDALASMIAGSVSGMSPKDVAVIDAVNRRNHRVADEEAMSASTYMEQAAKVESRVQQKLADHLSHMGGVIVSVAAVVDANFRSTTTNMVLPKGEGTVSVPRSERETVSKTSGASGAAEPGLGANLPLDINRAGGDSNQNSDTTSDIEYATQFGTKQTQEVDARGKPLRINVITSVPRDWVVQVIRQQKGDPAAEPTEAEIATAWTAEETRLKGLIKPLVQTEAGALASVADDGIVVTMIPVAMDKLPGGMAVASSLGGGGLVGSVAGWAESGLVKTVVIGLLAVASLGMMLMMVRKAGKAQSLPTAEELVGIPPALQPGSDVVGEADEGDTAMLGIEIGQDELKTKKMLEEVGELVKNNPGGAAQVLGRWLATEN